MKRKPLNIPTNKDPYEEVSFVNDMSPAQLKKLVKNLWGNLQDLAAIMDKSRPDVSNILDRIMDGLKWDEKDIDNRYWYGHYKGFVVKWDTLNKDFTLLNPEYSPIENPIQAISGEVVARKKAAK